MHYVGLSRVRKLQDVYILNLNESKIAVSEQVVREMGRLRAEAPLRVCLPILGNLTSDVKVIYHNSRSLHLHHRDLSTENNMLSGDIIAITESRLKCDDLNEDYNLPGFQMHRFDSNVASSDDRPYYGTVIYSKLQMQNMRKLCLCGIETVLCTTQVNEETIQLAFIYCPPKFASISNFQSFMTSLISRGLLDVKKTFVLMGDTNIDYFTHKELKTLERRLNVRQLMHSCTTDYDTCLDHIYTNMPILNSDLTTRISCATLESFYSDHKPIVTYLSI